MKCLESEKLIGYAYRLLDEAAAAQVCAHLGECPRCRGIVEQHRRLDTVLGEWKAAGPSPGFDARVRQAVEADAARRAARGFWGLEWARGLAVASLGLLIVASAMLLTHGRHATPVSPRAATRQARQAVGSQTPAQVAKDNPSAVVPGAGKQPGEPANRIASAGASSIDDKDLQALDDYDLAANFDLLSELSKRGKRVVN
jgi:anti-sigma factor RsiW